MAEYRHSNPPRMATPNGYTHVVEAIGSRIIYLSGQVAFDGGGNLVGRGDMLAQTRQVFENIRLALESVGATFESVVKLNIYLVSMADAQGARQIRDEYLNIERPPASTAVEVKALFRPDVLIEIEAVAVL